LRNSCKSWALTNAYLINPVLNSERARLRATDEQVAVAISGLRPNISASGDAAFRNQESDIAGGSGSDVECDNATRMSEAAFCAFLDALQQIPVRTIPATESHAPARLFRDAQSAHL
jgi:hypothetical protein